MRRNLELREPSVPTEYEQAKSEASVGRLLRASRLVIPAPEGFTSRLQLRLNQETNRDKDKWD